MYRNILILIIYIYTGVNCEKCDKFYYGNPLEEGGFCQFCNCNGNIDPNNPDSCDSKSGF
jgi:hypothetical protein